ncbi:MAG: protein kinase [Polyangiales bacterium]
MGVPVRLGAFELVEPLGQGGMGTVYRAVHGKERVPVAVKVMSAEYAREPKALAAFRREVRAVAALSHPNIVSVLDHEVIPPDVTVAEGFTLVPGSPYLVMELAEATLGSRPPPYEWQAVRDVLLALLDALAHAHSHGIIHRDIKPANVLWVRNPDGRGLRPKLSDFGLAHAMAGESEFARAAGTPAYMAPEQFRAQTRDFGPWTDLYSFGVLAYSLAAGRKPFEDKEDAVLAERHLKDPPPPLVARFAVPDGFERFLGRLLEKSPLRRYRFAADAAYALRELGEPVDDFEVTSRVTLRSDLFPELSAIELGDPMDRLRSVESIESLDGPTETTPTIGARPAAESVHDTMRNVDGLDSSSFATSSLTAKPRKAQAPARPTFDPELHRPPPIPETWRRATEPMPRHLLGAGLGLFGLRAMPLVGRTRERDMLWHTLGRVAGEHRPEAIVLVGPAGYGKTGLAEWFQRRAHEVGAAHTLSAVHDRGARRRRTLVELARQHLAVRGLDWAGASQRVRQYLAAHGVTDELERRALTDLVASSAADGRATRAMPMTAEHALLLRLLERAAVDRPVVVRLEDVQWGSDTLSFVEYVLDDANAPVLFVLTAQDEAIASDPAMKQKLAAFSRRLDVTYLPIGPLSPQDHGQLVRHMLHLGGSLADAVVERTAGNPLFARELVGDWVQRGVLVLGEEGFVLREGEQANLPDDLYDVWLAHVEATLRDPESERPALELAALLGLRVDAAEWRLACELAGFALPNGLVDRMLASRLVFLDEEPGYEGAPSFRFAHGMLRECLERSAVERGIAETLEAAIADSLLPRFETGEVDVAERLAHHLRRAGRLAEALEPLRACAELLVVRGEYDRALDVLDLRDATIAELGLPAGHHAVDESLLGRAEVKAARGAFDEAAELCERALAHAEKHGHDDVIPRALSLGGTVAWHRGDAKTAEDRLTEALQRFDKLGLPSEAARCLRGLAVIAAQEGRAEVAFNAFLASLELCRHLDDPYGVAASLIGMGLSDPTTPNGNPRPVEEALDVCEGRGYVYGVAQAMNALGEIARREGRLADAGTLLRRALEVSRGLGARYQETVFGLNLALSLVAGGRLREARTELGECQRRAERYAHRDVLFTIHAATLRCLVGAPDPKAFRYHVWAARRLLDDGSNVERDAVQLLEAAVGAATTLDALDVGELQKLLSEARARGGSAIPGARNLLTRG